MLTVFVLQHVRVDDDGYEDTKMIGIYSSIDAARAAVVRLRDKPGFCDNPNVVDPEADDYGGFNIDEYTIDEDNWVEGFGVPHP
jgi:hypothetical protein